MTNKTELKNMIDAIVNDEHETAQVHFHNFITAKMRSMIHPDQPEYDNTSDDSYDDED